MVEQKGRFEQDLLDALEKKEEETVLLKDILNQQSYQSPAQQIIVRRPATTSIKKRHLRDAGAQTMPVLYTSSAALSSSGTLPLSAHDVSIDVDPPQKEDEEVETVKARVQEPPKHWDSLLVAHRREDQATQTEEEKGTEQSCQTVPTATADATIQTLPMEDWPAKLAALEASFEKERQAWQTTLAAEKATWDASIETERVQWASDAAKQAQMVSHLKTELSTARIATQRAEQLLTVLCLPFWIEQTTF